MSLLAPMSAMPQTEPKKITIHSENGPDYSWEKKTHYFGKIKKDQPVTTMFTFKNTGNAPVMISQVNSPCGCTVAKFSKEAIAPGRKGNIKVTYNAAKIGKFSKNVTVTSNIEGGQVDLTIEGEVIAE